METVAWKVARPMEMAWNMLQVVVENAPDDATPAECVDAAFALTDCFLRKAQERGDLEVASLAPKTV